MTKEQIMSVIEKLRKRPFNFEKYYLLTEKLQEKALKADFDKFIERVN